MRDDGPPFVTRDEVRVLGALARWPAVGRIEAGEAAWDTFVARALPPDRAKIIGELAPWFTGPLIATEPGRRRLAHWFALKRPPLGRRAIERDLIALGCGGAKFRVVSTIRRMPAPVAHFIVQHAWLLAVGRSEVAWTAQAPPSRPGELHLILLDGRLNPDDLANTLAHEVSHCWLLPAAPQQAAATPIRDRVKTAARRLALAQAWGRVDTLLRESERQERLAAALAASWGFTGDAADPESCASRTRAAMQRNPNELL